MDSQNEESFFSVGANLVLLGRELPYDLYINSSALAEKEHFVRIFPHGGILSAEELANYKKKYHQLYINENHRDAYLKSLLNVQGASDVQKTEIIKTSAIKYLNDIFQSGHEFNTDLLTEAVNNCHEAVNVMVDVVKDYNINQIQELIGSMSFHDFYTYDHSINVSMYCISMLKTMKPTIDKKELVLIGFGGLLHDMGKIKIPTTILNNPDKLTDEEYAIIKTHPGSGQTLLSEVKNFPIDIDKEVVRRIIFEHHENYNGTGYPKGIPGKDIHLYARICAIADFFDALTTKRSYHQAMSTDEAMSIILQACGKKVDPEVFDILAKNVKKLVRQGNQVMEMEDNFDPGKPYNILPFKKFEAKKKDIDIFGKEESPQYGKVSKNEVPEKKKISG